MFYDILMERRYVCFRGAFDCIVMGAVLIARNSIKGSVGLQC